MNLNDVFDRFCLGAAILVGMLILLGALCNLSGCKGVDTASHQHGLVFYGGVDGRVGIGYGEIENVPLGSIFIREVYQSSPAFIWQQPGTNVTATVTIWDTCCAITNAPPGISNPNSNTNPLP